MDEQDDIIKEFLEESNENLDRLDNELVALETNPNNRDTLASVFRTIHTIKGTCGFLNFAKLEKVAHAGENLLSKLRDGEINLTPERTSALLAMVDAVRAMLSAIESTAGDGELGYEELIETLTALQQPTVPAADVAPNDAPREKTPKPEPTATGAVDLGDEREEILRDFLAESNENLDQLDNDLVALESRPEDLSILAGIFRTIHTIKGACGFLNFAKLEKVAHVGESLLSRLRDGEIPLTPERTTALLTMVDAVRAMLGVIETSGSDGDQTYGELIDTLARLQEPDHASLPPVKPPADPIPKAVPAKAVVTAAKPAVPNPPVPKPAAEPPKKTQGTSVAESSIRVDVGLLDHLMNLVGELVLTRNQILQYAQVREDTRFNTTSQRLNIITSELQEGVMKTRMQPIHNIWNKIPRIVRDMALNCGKQIRVEMHGKDTELDKSLIEAMKDPMTHLVRNCVDHGIETPDARTAKGKPMEGVLTLRAYHEGGQVNIEIADDGAGIPPDKLKAKALQKGLISPEQAAEMSDREVTHLIFQPGFSTAEKVTNISGRGVGMDVVKTNIEKISGTIELNSVQDKGTTFKINLPLTLAIIPALVITCGGQRFAIPQGSLQELIRLDNAQDDSIENIHGAPVYRLRGKLLPLVYLNKELELAQDQEQTPDESMRSANIVVLQADKRRFGLVVDQINDTQEIVVKPLATLLRGVAVFAGATVMGDGRVALILDILGLAQRAKVISESRDHGLVGMGAEQQDRAGERHNLLLVRSPGKGVLAIPLAEVARLEEFSHEALEWAGDREVVQYRGKILPLVRLSEVLEERRGMLRLVEDAEDDSAATAQVVVYTVNGNSLGLVVDKIIDIVEETLSVLGESTRQGVKGTTVIQGKVTEIFDVETFLERTMPVLYPKGRRLERA